MRILKNIFKIYINSSIHVAIAVCAFVGLTLIEFKISISYELLGFIFFGTITGYNFVKYAEIIRSRFVELYLYLRIIQILSLLGVLYFSLQISFFTGVISGGFALLTFFYAVPLLKSRNLRSITGLKIIIVATVWAGVSLLLPLVDIGVELDKTVWISFAQRLLFVFVLTLPFEIRDLNSDELALGTLPQRVGVFQTKLVGIVLLTLFFLLEFLKTDSNWKSVMTYGFISLVLIVFLLFSKRNQAKYYASFWVESIPILWYGIIFLLFK